LILLPGNNAMKQILQNLRNGQTMVVEVPIPTIQPGEALVRTAASLLSAGTERMVVEFAGKSLLGKARSRPDLVRQAVDKARREGILTTLEASFNRLDQPMPLGYSSAGVIVALGDGMTGWKVGQRVACAGGGYAVHAEYAAVPKNLMTRLPDSLDFEQAAFATLGAIALHGFRLSGAQLGECVAVIGLGLLGLLTVGIASAAGCRVLGIDLDARRVALAASLGAEAVSRPEAEAASLAFSAGRGCDVVLICADTPSSDPVELAGQIARDRAHVVAIGAIGLQLPRKAYYEKELSLINSRSYGPGRYDPTYEEVGQDYPIGYVRWTEGRNLEAVIDLLANRRLDVEPLISHRFPIEQAPQAYELITGKTQEPFLAVLLTYPGKPDLLQDEDMPQRPITSKRSDERSSEHSGTPSEPIPSSLASSLTTLPVERLKLGVLGSGNFATSVMLPAVHGLSGIELVGIASASGVSAQSAAHRFGFRYAASDENRLLADPQVNTVAILTRHNLHAQQVLAALAAGKHVFCEKPLALTSEEIDQIESALLLDSSSGSKEYPAHLALLMVGFNRRFAPLALHLADFLAGRAEPLIAHYRINAGYLPLNHWTQDPSQSGGRIIGEGCHFIDFLTFLVGTPPLAIHTHALPDIGRYREDNLSITLEFADGSLGLISYLANGNRSFGKERLEVFCAGRVAVLEDFRSLETVHDGRRQVRRSPLRQDKGHRAEWQVFADALKVGGPPPIPYTHLFAVTRASFAAVKSLRIRQNVLL
jgi:predicted dehydrogenase/threonine dehydrogenase-like Zn-dependent dehydrogenase